MPLTYLSLAGDPLKTLPTLVFGTLETKVLGDFVYSVELSVVAGYPEVRFVDDCLDSRTGTSNLATSSLKDDFLDLEVDDNTGVDFTGPKELSRYCAGGEA